MMNDQHRYSIEKYFDNERTFYTTTIGGANVNLSAQVNAGATSATLAAAWPYPSCQQQTNFTAPSTAVTAATTADMASGATGATLSVVWPYTTGVFSTTFSNNQVLQVAYTAGSATITFLGSLTSAATSTLTLASSTDTRFVTFTNGSTAISWQGALNGFASTSIATLGVQRYLIPAVISKMKIPEIFVGQLRYVPAPVETVAEWRGLNTLPYTSNITNYFFIYNGAVEFFPIPSSSGLLIQFDYKARVPDFSTAFLFSSTAGAAYSAGATVYDYQKGSLSGITAGSTSITGVSTAWNSTGLFPLNVDVSYYNLFLVINPPYGTHLTLATPIVNAPSSTAANLYYSIAQLPVLAEDFHDTIVYDTEKIYYNSIVKDSDKYKMYDALSKERHERLEEYGGTKQVNVDLGQSPPMNNPNLYYFGTG